MRPVAAAIQKWFPALALVTAGCALLAQAVYQARTQDPIPRRIDPKIYDDYTGFYDFGFGDVVAVRREGDRLVSASPGRLAHQLFPETESRFFFKGRPGRITFHRGPDGQVDSLISQWKEGSQKGRRCAGVPVAPAGTNGLVVATTGGAAVEAGLEILREGGSAVDAALATALCEVVHAGGSYVSFAGIMLLIYYEAGTGKVHYLDAQFQTPFAETDPRSIPKTGGRTALVPGFMAGVQAAHDKFGKLPFRRLFDRAIALAENGERVSPMMARWIQSKKSVLSRLPETKKIFTKENGSFYREGDWFRQPLLASTLRLAATNGAAYFYSGEWGRKFVEVIRRNGGKIAADDLASYRAPWREPLRTTYRDYEAFGPGLSAWGGLNNIEALNLLEQADLRSYGAYTASPQSLFRLLAIAECHKLTWTWEGFAGRNLSPGARGTKQTSAWIWQQLEKGNPAGLPGLPRAAARIGGNHSDGIIVVDRWGNMAVLGHTINTGLWGRTGIFVDGISIPDPAGTQQHVLAKIGPGKHLPNGMNPIIVLQEGKPFLGATAIGGGLHYKMLQALVNILDFQMDPQAAVDAPAFSGEGVEEGAFEPQLLERVRALGGRVNIIAPKDFQTGYWAGIMVEPSTGVLKGAVSRGLEGQVAGY